jgi:hypothetical protein
MTGEVWGGSSEPGEASRRDVPQDRWRHQPSGGHVVFYTFVFAGIAVLLVVAVIVQRSRNK